MSRPLTRAVACTLLSCACGAPAALADVTLEHKMSIESTGLMSVANMTGTTVTRIAGDRARTQSDLQMQSRMLRMLARNGSSTAEIVRLDQDRIYYLDLGKKTYRETTVQEQRALMEEAMEQMQAGQAQQRQAASGVDESQCEWSEARTDVQRGETAEIAGFRAERVTIKATQSCTDRQTGQVCEFGLTLDQWLAPQFDGAREARAYEQAYAEKLGFDAAASRDFAERTQSFFSGYADMWSALAEGMRGAEGYPVKTSFSLSVGGPQCEVARAQTSASDATPAGALGEALGGAFGGAIGGLLGRKKQASAPAEAAPKNGPVTLMTVTNELVSVSHDRVDPAAFEVPGDFTKE